MQTPRRFPAWIDTYPRALAWTDIGTERGLGIIRRFVASTEAEGVISTDEPTLRWLTRKRGLFEPNCRVMAPSAEVLERLMSKAEQAEIAAEAGFHVLPTWYLNHAGDRLKIPEAQFPVCVRPAYPNSVQPAFKAKVLVSGNEMALWLASLRITHPLIAQPFRVGPNMIVHGVRDLQGKMLALTAYRTSRKYRGLAQSIEPMELTGDLRDCCRRFIEASGIVGPFHFDLLYSDADACAWFLEVNARLGGTTAKVAGLGYDEPGLTMEAFGMALPAGAALMPGRRRVTSKRSLAKQILRLLIAKDAELSYPVESRPATLWHALREMALISDASLRLDDLEGSALYLLRSYTP